MKKVLVILISFFNFTIFSNYLDHKTHLKISFDKIFPETNIEKIHKNAINVAFLVNNFKDDIINNLIDELIEIYTISNLLDHEIKQKKSIFKNDILHIAKLMHNNKQLLNTISINLHSIQSINFIFDKVLIYLNNLIKNYQA